MRSRVLRPDPRERVAGPRPAPAAPPQAIQRPAIVFLTGEPGTPGAAYRIERAAAAATAAGIPNTVLTPDRIGARLDAIAAAAVLWIWRAPMDARIAAAIGAARRGGARIIFDVDDLMVDRAFAVPRIIDGMRTQRQTHALVGGYFDLIRTTMLEADCCVASTDELAGHIRRAGLPCTVIPNGADHDVMAASRAAMRARPDDGLLRIGYASGSQTHQRDFVIAAEAVGRALRRHPRARLVVFRSSHGPLLDVREFAELAGLEDRQLEWREHRPLAELPWELARFDINLAPLETGNPFCEAKSELKWFEAALVEVPTIASPTGPFRRAIRHGETGFLAATRAEWHSTLQQMIAAPALRQRLAAAAHREVLWQHGPEHRAVLVAEACDLAAGGRRAATAFALAAQRARPAPVPLVEAEISYAAEQHPRAAVTVVVPLYNYAGFVAEALDSVAAQTLPDLDLVVVDDASVDDSLALVMIWAEAHAERFGAITIMHHQANAGLAAARNTGIARAETPWVLVLDADNRLLPECARRCLGMAQLGDAAYVYPTLRKFGAETGLLSDCRYDPLRLVDANYIDALALISRAAWSAAGGYHDGKAGGWEDYDLWCRLAELGLRGQHVDEPLAEYRVHASSMSRTTAADAGRSARIRERVERQHPWLRLA